MEKSHNNDFSWQGVTWNYPHGAEGVTRNDSDQEESQEMILIKRSHKKLFWSIGVTRNDSDQEESQEMILIKRSRKKLFWWCGVPRNDSDQEESQEIILMVRSHNKLFWWRRLMRNYSYEEDSQDTKRIHKKYILIAPTVIHMQKDSLERPLKERSHWSLFRWIRFFKSFFWWRSSRKNSNGKKP
jgi:hypothetical protein